MWDCKHHIVWIPKYRKKARSGDLRKYFGNRDQELAMQKECMCLKDISCLIMFIFCFPFTQAFGVSGYWFGQTKATVWRRFSSQRCAGGS
jgi:hypothetical protein